MKKVLSLILALAMVLSCVPFVFAEGEEAAAKTEYDFAEAFLINETFDGKTKAEAYPKAGFTQSNDSKALWSVGYYPYDGNNDGTADYDTFKPFSILHRGKQFNRAYQDTTYTTMTLQTGVTLDPTMIPGMVYTEANTGLVEFVTTKNTWYHYTSSAGAGQKVVGDGGWGVQNVNRTVGSLGYTFGQGTYGGASKSLVSLSAMGNHSNASTSAHQAAIFTAPKAGLVKAEISVWANNDSAVAYKLYKEDTAGNITLVYPTSADTPVSITAPNSSLTVPEKWQNNWVGLPVSQVHTKNDGYVWVNQDDKLILRFAPQGTAGANKEYNLDKLLYTYVGSYATEFEAEYKTNHHVDLRDAIELPLEGATVTVDEDVLTLVEGTTYALANDYIDGTETIITVVNGATTQTITASFKEMQMVYDAAELWKTDKTYDGSANDYLQAGQPFKMPNNGNSIWTAGYYASATNYDTLTPFAKLSRLKTTRAYEDDKRTTLPAGMVWTTDRSIDANGDDGYALGGSNGTNGSLGYNFGYIKNGNTSKVFGSSAVGGAGSQQALVFKAPRAGVINPAFSAAASNGASQVVYRMDKIATDGTVVPIYPLVSKSEYNFTKNTAGVDLPAKWAGNWGELNWGSYKTCNNEYVRVNAGDTIVLRFAGTEGNTGKSFDLDYVTMTYIDGFEDGEEVFQNKPFADYEETTTIIYPTKESHDFRIKLLNPDAKGTVVYSVEGDSEEDPALKAGNPAGVYELTGKLSTDGSLKVKATYLAPDGTPTGFTTSTIVYVKPASEGEDTFDKYDVFDLSEMDYAFDEAFVLPYYTNAAERAIYGEIDLGITEMWDKATVTFDVPGKFEYLGNGRIRALASHTWTQAGGTVTAAGAPGTADSATIKSVTGSSTLKSIRNTTSMGTPVVMTVKATDGGVRQFGLWAFPTTVQDLSVEGANPNAYKLYYGKQPGNPSQIDPKLSNAVVSVEVYDAVGNFTPTYAESAYGGMYASSWYAYSPVADHRYTMANGGSYPAMRQDGTIEIPYGRSGYWNGYVSNQAYPGWIGLSQTFTAPKDGTINLTGYFPADGLTVTTTVSAIMVQNKNIDLSVGLYDTDGTLIDIVWSQSYGPENATATTMKRLGSPVVNNNYATLDDDETLTIENVKKGQKIRVMIGASDEIQSNASKFTFTGDYKVSPVWTYGLDYPDEFSGNSILVTPATALSNLNADSILTMFYDADGELLDSKIGATLDEDNDCVNVEIGDLTPAYAKIFFWNDLDNIQPITSDITVRTNQ